MVLVVATDRQQAKERAVAKWKGAPPGHLDALERIERVDGFAVTLAEVGGGDRREMETFN